VCDFITAFVKNGRNGYDNITILLVDLLINLFFLSARPELVEGFERSILQQVQDERSEELNAVFTTEPDEVSG